MECWREGAVADMADVCIFSARLACVLSIPWLACAFEPPPGRTKASVREGGTQHAQHTRRIRVVSLSVTDAARAVKPHPRPPQLTGRAERGARRRGHRAHRAAAAAGGCAISHVAPVGAQEGEHVLTGGELGAGGGEGRDGGRHAVVCIGWLEAALVWQRGRWERAVAHLPY